MNPRFSIEEHIRQDDGGVVFRGHDSETNATVAIRRFFPFGAGGGGFDATEQQEYREAVAALKSVNHEAIRRVIDGGCDPVDGIPYLVTLWQRGDSLAELLARQGQVAPELAGLILTKLLDGCLALSSVLGQNELWLDTAPESVVVVNGESETCVSQVSFGICPWRWLGAPLGDGGAAGVARFADRLLGWTGRIAPDHAAGGLGGWVRRLRQGEITDLQEARAELLEWIHTGSDAPAPIAMEQPQITVERLPSHGKIHFTPWLIVPGTAVAVAAGVFWFVSVREPAEALATEDPPAQRRTAQGGAQAKVDDILGRIQGETSSAKAHRASVDERGFLTIADHDLLLERAGREVVLRGRLTRVRMSQSGKTMYLEFSANPPTHEVRAYAMAANLVDGIRPRDLESLVGKSLEIRGPLEREQTTGGTRPRIKLSDAKQISVVGE